MLRSLLIGNILFFLLGGMMTVRVGTTEQRPNYHLKLAGTSNAGVSSSLGLILCDSKGRPTPLGITKTSYPRTALKIGQGNGGYGDFEMPYTPIVQGDWGGGRGQADFDKDASRFYDSWRCDTTRGDLRLGPLANLCSGLYSSIVESSTYWPPYDVVAGVKTLKTGYTSYGLAQPVISYDAVAFKMTNGAAEVVLRSITITINSPAVTKWNTYGKQYQGTVSVYSDNSGPDTLLASSTQMVKPGQTAADVYLEFNNLTLAASTSYWIAVSGFGGGVGEYSSVNYYVTAADKIYTRNIMDPPQTWDEDTEYHGVLAMKMTTSIVGGKKKFFEYKGQLYCFEDYAGLQSPKLYTNGMRGVAKSNTGHLEYTLTGVNPATWNIAGKIIKIVGGAGSAEPTPWRRVTGYSLVGSDYALTVTPSWTITQGTDTEFVILGGETWTEITGTSSASSDSNIKDMATKITRCTDVLVVDDIVYVAQGTTTPIGRIRLQTTGVWNDCEQENTSSNKYADFLELITNTEGQRKIWRAEALASKVSSASPIAWSATDLTWGSDITCGNKDVPITGLCAYGNPQQPWVFKEDSFGSISNDIFAVVPLGEMRNARSHQNGAACTQHGVYLYFSMLEGLERYYEQRLDDMGPNRDEGLPELQRGSVAHMVGYPGRLYAAVDAGYTGYSSVLCHNGLGWHEIYRGNQTNRIRAMHIQTLPDMVDRLWVSEGADIYWLPIVINPRTETEYEYAESGSLVSAWFYGGFKDVVKFWRAVSLFSENLTANRYVKLEYQTDAESDSDAWHTLASNYVTSPEQEIDLSSTHSVIGKRWRYRLTLYRSSDISPVITALRADVVTRVPPKSSWQITFLLEDSYTELDGVATTTTAASIEAALAAYADSDQYARPLLMSSNQGLFDNKYVFVDPSTFQLLEAGASPADSGNPTRKVKAIGRFTVYEA